jgi:hypothetical protein
MEMDQEGLKVDRKFQGKIKRMMNLMIELWIDVGGNEMKFSDHNQINTISDDFYFLLLMENLKT